MKIEKISDNQIRCTLSKEDLIDRELKLSELAYGTEKAKALFRDMIQQAAYEFGFEVGDIPLMIEAIPISTESLVLVITKVEDPEELDTRFSSFTSLTAPNDNIDEEEDELFADEIISRLEEMEAVIPQEDDEIDDILEMVDAVKSKTEEKTKIISNLTKIYSFNTLDEVTMLSKVLYGFYTGDSTLYKSRTKTVYYLVINKSNHTPEEFNKVCNIISEYGKPIRSTYATQTFLDEHYEVIIKNKTINVLSVI